ncbi:hypothetical protein Vafri_7648 [Volvox africanus]|uniref:Uncharacterized protein n=1 Tax=Volvox africanus TaxID=51714 RepID=A0A8J4EX67_9CHLO|nr:hypothetical protein Vafri_7648 [Volvox africanus]
MRKAGSGPDVQPEDLNWKLIGAFIWHASMIIVSNAFFAVLPPSDVRGLFRPSRIGTYTLLYVFQAISLLCHRMVLSSNGFQPVTFKGWLIHVRARSWVSVVLTRIFARGRSWKCLVATAGFFGANLMTAIAYVALYGRLRFGAHATDLWFGVLMAACYSCIYLYRSKDVLAYPAIQRVRFFRVKERVPKALQETFLYTVPTLLVFIITRRSLVPLGLLWGCVVSCELCVIGWVLGGEMLQIVFTERVQLARPESPDPNEPLLSELASNNPFMQDLALLDLAVTAEGHGGEAAWRRTFIFMDQSGRAAWGPLASYMLGEIRDFTEALAAALPSASADMTAASRLKGATGPAASNTAVRWNVLLSSPSANLRILNEELDLAAWNVRNKFYRINWCMRGLSGLAVAAQRGEDRYGVVLLCEPTLPTITLSLLSAVLALQQYTKSVTAARSRRSSWLNPIVGHLDNVMLQPVEEVAFAVEVAARNAVNRLAVAYGDRLRECVQRVERANLAYGSKSDLESLLATMLT